MTQLITWLTEAFAQTGIRTCLGQRLWTVLLDAGPQPSGMIGVQPHSGPGDVDAARRLADIISTAAPLIERTGVATTAQISPETLPARKPCLPGSAKNSTPPRQRSRSPSCSAPGPQPPSNQ